MASTLEDRIEGLRNQPCARDQAPGRDHRPELSGANYIILSRIAIHNNPVFTVYNILICISQSPCFGRSATKPSVIMSAGLLKPEVDYTKDVDKLIPEAENLAKVIQHQMYSKRALTSP